MLRYPMPKTASSGKRSSRSDIRLLLDANLSRIIVQLLGDQYDADVRHISSYGLDPRTTDPEIISLAKKENRIIITHDLDYGEIYYLHNPGTFGVIMLRLSDQTTSSVMEKLKQFFDGDQYKTTDITKRLVIISDDKVRVYPK